MVNVDAEGYIKIGNEADRMTIASLLFKNGYCVEPVRIKKDGRSYEYFVKYTKRTQEKG